MENWGSSPLARGLRRAMSGLGLASGIIPARAGFTSGPTPPARRCADHPRSRGVYVDSVPLPTPVTGSSPLARGLHLHPHASERPHPGSSPLARGLRSLVGSFRFVFRIIPARAGFTALLVRISRPCMGSSPLARGLRGGEGGGEQPGGIIPARAGFTRVSPGRGRRCRDHPRSRGVYEPETTGTCEGPGSSPLARGLHISR